MGFPKPICKNGHVYAAGTYRETVNGAGRKFRLCLKCRARTAKNGNQFRIYGITLEQRNVLLSVQGDSCAACSSKEPKGVDWHTDHNHLTGKVRGLLCHPCNLALGQVKDRIDILQSLIEYLKRTQDGSLNN